MDTLAHDAPVAPARSRTSRPQRDRLGTRAALHTAAAEKLARRGPTGSRPTSTCAPRSGCCTASRGLPTSSTGCAASTPRPASRAAATASRPATTAATSTNAWLIALLDDQRPGRPGPSGICVALVDVDHFKLVNDTYGHLFGDRVLQRLVSELDVGLPEGAFCARYGGEEFALVLPGRGIDDRRRGLRGRPRPDRPATRGPSWTPDLRVTVSIGVAHSTGRPTEVERLVGEADAAALRRQAGGPQRRGVPGRPPGSWSGWPAPRAGGVRSRNPYARPAEARSAARRKLRPSEGAGPGRRSVPALSRVRSGRWRGRRFGPCPALPGRTAPRQAGAQAARPGRRRGVRRRAPRPARPARTTAPTRPRRSAAPWRRGRAARRATRRRAPRPDAGPRPVGARRPDEVAVTTPRAVGAPRADRVHRGSRAPGRIAPGPAATGPGGPRPGATATASWRPVRPNRPAVRTAGTPACSTRVRRTTPPAPAPPRTRAPHPRPAHPRPPHPRHPAPSDPTPHPRDPRTRDPRTRDTTDADRVRQAHPKPCPSDPPSPSGRPRARSAATAPSAATRTGARSPSGPTGPGPTTAGRAGSTRPSPG